ncbi:MAG: hypothetical protein N4A54_05955 [Peptostreptococcaceae bacterium]|jgi:hypothetical protein|nr:hypothetical protein [Peptostreptococcaceae bacterium]
MIKKILKKFKENIKEEIKEEILKEINQSKNEYFKENEKIKLKENLNGRSIHKKVIPTVYNLSNLLIKLKQNNWNYSELKQWEKRCYKAYDIASMETRLKEKDLTEQKNIIRNHILSNDIDCFGAHLVDIYIVAYVSENYGTKKEIFEKYLMDNDVTKRSGSVNAIYQVGKNDGIFLGILNNDGTVLDWDFMKRWIS